MFSHRCSSLVLRWCLYILVRPTHVPVFNMRIFCILWRNTFIISCYAQKQTITLTFTLNYLTEFKTTEYCVLSSHILTINLSSIMKGWSSPLHMATATLIIMNLSLLTPNNVLPVNREIVLSWLLCSHFASQQNHSTACFNTCKRLLTAAKYFWERITDKLHIETLGRLNCCVCYGKLGSFITLKQNLLSK